MSHTKGKLTCRKNPGDEGKYDLLGEEKNSYGYAPLAHVKGDKRVTGGNGEANARRLVACWNAFAGVPTGLIEAATYKDPHVFLSCVKNLDSIIEERDKLRKAAEKAADLLDELQLNHEQHAVFVELRKALETK